MEHWKINLFWTWASLFLAMGAFAFAYPVAPFMLEDVYGVSSPRELDWFISLFAFSGNLGFFIFAPLWGKMADVYGRKMMMTRANFCAACLLPFLAWMPGVWSLIILRFFIGSLSGSAAAAMALVACTTPEKYRGTALGVVSSAIFSGNLAGIVIGGFAVNALGYHYTFVLCGALGFTAAAISHFLVRGKMPPKEERPKMRWLPGGLPKLGNVWYIMLLTLLMGYVQQIDAPFLPLLVKDVLQSGNHEAMKWNGFLGGAAAAAGMVGGFALGYLSDRISGHIVGIACAVLGAMFILPQSWCTSLNWLFAERMAMIFFVAGLSPVMQSWLSLTTAQKERGAMFGYATSARSLGWLIGGAVGAAVTGFWGTRSVFASAAVSLLLLALLTALIQKIIPFPTERKDN